MAENRYSADHGKRVAKCQKCKTVINKGELRLAKITANNPFAEDKDMKNYFHPNCLFETFKNARATTKIIEEPGDVEGFEDVNEDDKKTIRQLIRDSSKDKKGGTPAKKRRVVEATPARNGGSSEEGPLDTGVVPPKKQRTEPSKHKDDSFRQFRRLCAQIADEPGYNNKTDIVRKFFSKGTDGNEFQGDLYVWVRLLLPGVSRRIYNLQSKQLIKIFARIFKTSEEDMLEDLEAGDVAETVSKFFEESKSEVKPAGKSLLTIHDVDFFLASLAKQTREDAQQKELTSVAERCTANDLKMVVRLIKHDLRIQAGPKHILEALHKDGYEAFNSTRNVDNVLDKILELKKSGNPEGPLDVGVSLMHPVHPMLAMACKSVDMAFQKCPNGMYAEIKYDGERIQLHKKGSVFKYFSRSLKPVLQHKVKPFAEYIPKAFPDGSDLILDAEVLMVDNKTGEPLPFGTLGVHKAKGFKDATPCLFVFDCIYYNGKSLMDMPISSRRKFLEDHMKEVDNHIKFSEVQIITKKEQLGNMIKRVLAHGLEGLVLKDLKSVYEPKKRHWLKVKKDYLNEGSMADSADLVVLGGWYGTGNKGGLISVFLMGCYDEDNEQWCTVTKVHTGVDDATLDKLQKSLLPLMTKIKQDHSAIPKWLKCTKQMAPDFVVKDPKKSPVWEITGAEFTQAEIHTADGISIRFPRITKQRQDKTWETATSLNELKDLFKASKEKVDFDIDYSSQGSEEENGKEPIKAEESEGDDDFSGSKETQPMTITNVKVKPEEDDCAVVEREGECDNGFTYKCVGASYNKIHMETEYGFVLDVIQGDLFATSEKVSLAHCVSRDYKLGKGIAKLFREKFGRISELHKSGAEVGGVAVLKDGKRDRFIYNLVTKPKYNDKPTYKTLESSLKAMLEHAKEHNVEEIAMPKIGCGLDGLQWNAVRTLIKNVFQREKMKITVYSLDPVDSPVIDSNTKHHKIVKISPSKAKALVSPTDTSPRAETTNTVSKQRTIDDMFRVDKRKKTKQVPDDGEERPDESDYAPPAKRKKDSNSISLPDIFTGWRIVLMDGLVDPGRLKRYTIAFGGEILQESEAKHATHVLYPEQTDHKLTDARKEALHLVQDFLVDSIRLQRPQDANKYLA